MSSSIQVIDNFLPEDVFYPFATALMSNGMYTPADCASFRQESDNSVSSFGENLKTDTSLAETLFSANIFYRDMNVIHTSEFWLYNPDWFDTLAKELNVKRWMQLRVNCTTGQLQPHTGGYHIDFSIRSENYKTAILYLNTNNGGTQIRREKESTLFVKSQKNKLVKFPTFNMHAAVWATDAKLRFVLNMTYEEI
tara:strand:+ start:205 stop:789 length:585 start_codon:yes stop_codon:yes gene_type:complete